MNLWTLDNHTPNEVLEYVTTHLLKQGEKAFNWQEASCQYKTVEGLECAVGCLIPEDMYHSDMEGCDVAQVIGIEDLEVSEEHLRNLQALQAVHDDFPVFMWRQVLTHMKTLTVEERYQLVEGYVDGEHHEVFIDAAN